MNVLAIVLARAGSNGVERKNTVDCMVAGQPLIAWTLLDIEESRSVNQQIVSTDDEPTMEWLREEWPTFWISHRPVHLAGPDVSSEDAMAPIIEQRQPDIIVLLQLTSPVRTGQDIDNAVRMIAEDGYDSVLSVAPSHAFLWNEHISDGMWSGLPFGAAINYVPYKRPLRQDIKQPWYEENGSIYVFTMETWRKYRNRLGGRIGLCHMAPEARLQIDDQLDLYLVERIMERQAVPA